MRYIFFILMLFSSITSAAEQTFLLGAGVHPSKYTLTPQQLVSLLVKYKIKVIRYDYPWSQVELKKGQYTPPNFKLDKLVKLANDNGIKVILILNYRNRLYGNGKPVSHQEQVAFSKYAAWVANRFKGSDVIYEIWNEWPYLKDERLGPPFSKESAIAYVELVKTASQAIRDVVPNAYVIAGSYNPLNDRFDGWSEEIIKAGIFNYINALSVHPYSYQQLKFSDPNYGISVLDKLHSKIKRMINRDVQFYVTEFGFPDYQASNNLSKSQRFDFTKQYILKARERGYIVGLVWYDLINDGNDSSIKEHNFGLLDSSFNERENMSGFSAAEKSLLQNNNAEVDDK
ncbi:TPA: cellulase family glycosylhydrolase [Klebsiella pneumoniae]|uniref:cellulase family glycosylhydrolase n=1 Tax=Klebsiella pneumoniae complex TaxID=3390273 RepID=UPI000C149D4F|nr:MULTISPECIES: cellulase family glycosylhydrolase [Klebsiella]MCM6406707.1 glycoside hydrolase family 5 protein [Klebsiella pneumoniae]PHZ78922.1 hypothetical protein CQB04_22290 [Klebsiella pneumoniae]SYJ79542.1 Partial Putative uncharacterized protein precursor [Klebsiella pneumoniae]VGH59607.1 Partial Putative uncharacterized protein precursor [Klebsiella quasipneumoniae]HBZ5596739.1 glycoside hydrolase family 5 protein [Klebsiella pneumoniae]